MTDQEGMTNLNVTLNKILAQEIMGWKGKRLSGSSAYVPENIGEDGCEFCNASPGDAEHDALCPTQISLEVWDMGDEKTISMAAWNPTGYIGHALMILEKLRRANGGDYSVIITDLGDFWHVTLGDEHREPVHRSGFSTSLEWAICRAALKSLEKDYGG